MRSIMVGLQNFGARAAAVIDVVRSVGLTPYARAWITGADVPQAAADRIHQPYAQHPAVYRAIKIKASSIAQLEIEVWPKGADRRKGKPIADHWLPALLSSPSTELRGEQLIEALVTYLDVDGEAFLWHLDLGRDGAGKPRRPKALALLPPRAMWPKFPLGPQGEITGWTWHSPAGAKTVTLEELTFVKRFNPYQPERGLSPLRAAQVEYTGDHRAAVWNRSLIENGAMPPIFFSSDSTWVDEDRTAFIDDFQQRFGGPMKTGRAAALPKGVKAEAFKQSHLEMEWMGGRKLSRENIFSVLGVPPGIAGIFDGGNYANRREQMKFLWYVTLMPDVRMLEATLTDLVQRYEPDKVVFFKTEPVLADVNAADYQAKVETASKLMQWGWPPAVVSDALALGLPTANMPWLAVGYLPYSLVTAGDVVRGETFGTPDYPGDGGDADEEEETETDDDQDPALIEDQKLARRRALPPAPAMTRLLAQVEAMQAVRAPLSRRRDTEDERTQLWSGLAARYGDIGRAYNKKLRTWLWGMRTETLGKVRSEKGGASGLTRAAGDDLLWDSAAAKKELREISKRAWLQSIRRGVDVLEGEVGFAIDFDLHDPAVAAYVGAKEIRIVGIEERIREDLRATLIEGLAANETEAELAARVRVAFDGERSNAATIARTETGQSFSAGRYEGMRQAGIKRHEWLTARDAKVRESHDRMDGEVVVIGEPFSNGLVRPGDLRGPADEVINCRCTTVAVVEAVDEED